MKLTQAVEEKDGQTSGRRLSAIYCILFASFLSLMIILLKEINNWYIFIPVALFLFVSIMLFFFTTWADIKELVAVIVKKGKKE